MAMKGSFGLKGAPWLVLPRRECHAQFHTLSCKFDVGSWMWGIQDVGRPIGPPYLGCLVQASWEYWLHEETGKSLEGALWYIQIQHHGTGRGSTRGGWPKSILSFSSSWTS